MKILNIITLARYLQKYLVYCEYSIRGNYCFVISNSKYCSLRILLVIITLIALIEELLCFRKCSTYYLIKPFQPFYEAGNIINNNSTILKVGKQAFRNKITCSTQSSYVESEF